VVLPVRKPLDIFPKGDFMLSASTRICENIFVVMMFPRMANGKRQEEDHGNRYGHRETGIRDYSEVEKVFDGFHGIIRIPI
jgi:hypothetical protein